MQISVLHLDDAINSQAGFLEACNRQGARHLRILDEGRKIRLWGRDKELNALAAKLQDHIQEGDTTSPLFFMGSGDFHHVSALLAEAVAKKIQKPLTILHFDNHPDWVHFHGGMHCGSWVHRALRHPSIVKIITVGVCSDDLDNPDRKGANLKPMAEGRLEVFPYHHAPSRVRWSYGKGAGFSQIGNEIHWQNIASIGEDEFLQKLLTRIQTDAVYITIDKDVLSHEDAETNWDQGQMRLPWLLDILRTIGERHYIAGADVTGDYSSPVYGGNPIRRLLKHAEIFLDQPHRRPNLPYAANLNSSVNMALLETFSEIMA